MAEKTLFKMGNSWYDEAMTDTQAITCYSTSCPQGRARHEFATYALVLAHELSYHNGAQTCWTPEDVGVNRDAYPSASGVTAAQ